MQQFEVEFEDGCVWQVAAEEAAMNRMEDEEEDDRPKIDLYAVLGARARPPSKTNNDPSSNTLVFRLGVVLEGGRAPRETHVPASS